MYHLNTSLVVNAPIIFELEMFETQTEINIINIINANKYIKTLPRTYCEKCHQLGLELSINWASFPIQSSRHMMIFIIIINMYKERKRTVY